MIKHDSIAWGVFLLRVSGSFFMIYGHGWPKLIRLFSGDPVRFYNPLGIGAVPSLILVVLAEFLCALFILLGLFTRLSAIPLIISMAVASFIHHGGDTLAGKELPLIYLLIFTTLLLTGPGRFSLQHGLGLSLKTSGKPKKFLLQ
ncbi:DoxX family protein [bacterium]|nr:DoxX family protein [bacterium]